MSLFHAIIKQSLAWMPPSSGPVTLKRVVPMIQTDYLFQLYQYHYWANLQVLATAAILTPEQLFRPQGHSWGSVYGILFHMTNAEWIWLQRWKGFSPPSLPAPDQFPDLESVRTRWEGLESEITAYISAQDSTSLQREVQYTNTSGMKYHLPLWQMMVHVPNHGTHHRGELAAMFAQMEIDHSEEDWLYYFLSISKQR
jgi:uncharacterized damage-inducible protein DinB